MINLDLNSLLSLDLLQIIYLNKILSHILLSRIILDKKHLLSSSYSIMNIINFTNFWIHLYLLMKINWLKKNWRNNMNDKLIINVNQFNDETIYIIYMMSKLENNIVKYIFAQHCFDSLNSFTLIYKLFNYLKEIYDELNKNQKFWHEYNALK